MELGMALDGIDDAQKIAMAHRTAGPYARTADRPEGSEVMDSPR